MERVFSTDATDSIITVTRKEFNLKLTPGEADKATQLLGIALGMESLQALPSHIANPPFVIRFFDDDNLALERSDAEGSIPFNWTEGDRLITALQDGVSIAVNARTIARPPRRGFTSLN